MAPAKNAFQSLTENDFYTSKHKSLSYFYTHISGPRDCSAVCCMVGLLRHSDFRSMEYCAEKCKTPTRLVSDDFNRSKGGGALMKALWRPGSHTGNPIRNIFKHFAMPLRATSV